MKKNYTICAFSVLTCFYSVRAQTANSHIFFRDSISPVVEGNYQEAKSIYLRHESKCEYDPGLVLYFLELALENNDVVFFQEKIQQLILKYGYRYSYDDTVKLSYELNDDFKLTIHKKGLSKWMINCTEHYYPEWIKNHPNAINFETFKELIYTKDQFVREYSYKIRSECLSKIEQDSATYKMLSTSVGRIFDQYNLENVYLIRELVEANNNQLPTNFDCIGISIYLELVVFHNMKNQSNYQLTWEILHDAYEEAYIAGKIPDNFFNYYDKYLYEFKGFQYYGTLGEKVPVDNQREFVKRKQRLGL